MSSILKTKQMIPLTMQVNSLRLYLLKKQSDSKIVKKLNRKFHNKRSKPSLHLDQFLRNHQPKILNLIKSLS
jgi:hypothetical protein